MKRKNIMMCLCLFLAGVAISLAQEPDIDLSETIHDYGNVAVGDSIDIFEV